jgi:hypothetical protein
MSFLHLRWSLLVISLLVAIGGFAAPTAPLPPAAVALAQSGSGAAQAAGADAVFDTIRRQVAELRGLTPRQDVPRITLTPEELQARTVQDMSDPETQASIEHSRQLMVALGLLAPDVDLYALELAFRSGIVLGQYDPDTKQLYVVTGTDPTSPLARVTFAHEYTHALQDQHYDIRALLPKSSDNSDRDLAVSALLEGDALIMEQLFQRQALTPAERQAKQRQEGALAGSLDLSQVPLVLREETYFPYELGPDFIATVIGQEGVREALEQGTGYGPRVNRLFENPPRSSAQIIHPQKYLNGVAPIRVMFPDLAAALGEGWQQLEADVLGEIDHRILIQQFLDRRRGDQAAAGWAGDAFALLSNGSQVAVVVSSRWDDPTSAVAWYDAYQEALQARYGGRLELLEQRPERTIWRTPDGVQALSRAGTIIHLLLAPMAEQTGRLERALTTSEGVAGQLIPAVAVAGVR